MQVCARADVRTILVTHSIAEAAFLSDCVVVLAPRPTRITGIEAKAELFSHVRRHIFTSLHTGDITEARAKQAEIERLQVAIWEARLAGVDASIATSRTFLVRTGAGFSR